MLRQTAEWVFGTPQRIWGGFRTTYSWLPNAMTAPKIGSPNWFKERIYRNGLILGQKAGISMDFPSISHQFSRHQAFTNLRRSLGPWWSIRPWRVRRGAPCPRAVNRRMCKRQGSHASRAWAYLDTTWSSPRTEKHLGEDMGRWITSVLPCGHVAMFSLSWFNCKPHISTCFHAEHGGDGGLSHWGNQFRDTKSVRCECGVMKKSKSTGIQFDWASRGLDPVHSHWKHHLRSDLDQDLSVFFFGIYIYIYYIMIYIYIYNDISDIYIYIKICSARLAPPGTLISPLRVICHSKLPCLSWAPPCGCGELWSCWGDNCGGDAWLDMYIFEDIWAAPPASKRLAMQYRLLAVLAWSGLGWHGTCVLSVLHFDFMTAIWHDMKALKAFVRLLEQLGAAS